MTHSLPSYPLPPLRVLVVDDCPDTRKSLRVLLRIWGHHVCEAGDAASALQSAEVFRPDVVLMDIVLPGQDGLDLAERMLNLPGLDGLAVVALTGHHGLDKLDRAYELGARHYLVKPADPVLLRGLLGSIRYPADADLCQARRAPDPFSLRNCNEPRIDAEPNK